MSKYDFEIDLSQNSSTGIILDKIKEGSVVLEFGCAEGRMTRYMKEILGCQVYIVEYDKGAYEKALNYADDGLCDDILSFQWVEKFKGTEFDVIIFADVLEHLTAPEKALEHAVKLLKDTGYIYVSLPNITHNDILLKAYEEHFDYTPTGLLDDTHVHFWGLKNIEMLSGRYGLSIRSIEGTYRPTGLTEQYAQTGNNSKILLKNILNERQCGEVYQFIITLDKCERPEDAAVAFRTASIKSHIYLDTGNGFNENERFVFDSEYSGHGSYAAHYVISNTGKINRVRFDPIEFQSCILRNVSITQGNEKLQLIWTNAVKMKNGFFLAGTDPMVCADILSKDDPIKIDADIMIPGEKYIEMMQDALVDKQSELEHLMTGFNHLTAEKNEYQRRIAGLTDENESLRAEVDRFVAENKELQGRTGSLNGEIEALRVDLGAYIILVNNKDKYALELEREKQRLEKELEKELKYYQNLKVVKFHFYVARIWRGIKRRLKRLIGKEGH